MKQKGFVSILVIIVTLAIGAAIGIGAFVATKQLTKGPKPAPSVSPWPTDAYGHPRPTPPSPPPAPIDTSNWETYTNTAVGYTLQYPHGIQINELDAKDIEVVRIGVSRGGQGGNEASGGMVLSYRGNEGIVKGNDLVGAPIEHFQIDGYNAIRAKYQNTGPYIDDIFIPDDEDKRVIRASINTAGDKGYETSTFQIFEEMIRTFRYINQMQLSPSPIVRSQCQTNADCAADEICAQAGPVNIDPTKNHPACYKKGQPLPL